MAAIKKGMILGDVYVFPQVLTPLSRKKWPVWASPRSRGVNGTMVVTKWLPSTKRGHTHRFALQASRR